MSRLSRAIVSPVRLRPYIRLPWPVTVLAVIVMAGLVVIAGEIALWLVIPAGSVWLAVVADRHSRANDPPGFARGR